MELAGAAVNRTGIVVACMGKEGANIKTVSIYARTCKRKGIITARDSARDSN